MITILGASGFVGSHLVKELKKRKEPYYAPHRDESLLNKDLGDIIYCIGMTADFRAKPFETVEAHVTKLSHILKECNSNSLTYLSSTRVYVNSLENQVFEDSKILIDVLNSDDLYTLTKLTGERICLSSGKKVRIIRLSNIIGNDLSSNNFLTAILKDIFKSAYLKMYLSPNSAKDYLLIDDAVKLILKITKKGKDQIYNLASGYNIRNDEIIKIIKQQLDFSCDAGPTEMIFPKISIKKISDEFKFTPQNVLNFIPELIKQMRNV